RAVQDTSVPSRTRTRRRLPAALKAGDTWLGSHADTHLRNRLCAKPAATPNTAELAGPRGATGRFRSLVVPSPSWPAALAPQASGAPPCWMARLWKAPAAMVGNGVLGATGVPIERRVSVGPIPSWPWLLRLQAAPPLLVRMARLWAPPQAIAFTVRPSMAGVGVRRFVVSP